MNFYFLFTKKNIFHINEFVGDTHYCKGLDWLVVQHSPSLNQITNEQRIHVILLFKFFKYFNKAAYMWYNLMKGQIHGQRMKYKLSSSLKGWGWVEVPKYNIFLNFFILSVKWKLCTCDIVLWKITYREGNIHIGPL